MWHSTNKTRTKYVPHGYVLISCSVAQSIRHHHTVYTEYRRSSLAGLGIRSGLYLAQDINNKYAKVSRQFVAELWVRENRRYMIARPTNHLTCTLPYHPTGEDKLFNKVVQGLLGVGCT